MDTLYDLLIYKRVPFWKAIKVKNITPSANPRYEGPGWINRFSPKIGRIRLSEGIVIQSSDRARPYEEGGLFGSARHVSINHSKQRSEETMVSRSYLFMRSFSQNVRERRRAFSIFGDHSINIDESVSSNSSREQALLIRDLVKNACKKSREKKAFDHFVNKAIEQERIKHTVRRNGALELISLIVTGKSPKDGTKLASFLEYNKWIVAEVQASMQRLHVRVSESAIFQEDVQRIVLSLTSEYPELLSPFEETQYGLLNATLVGLIRFCEVAVNNKKKYPSFKDYSNLSI